MIQYILEIIGQTGLQPYRYSEDGAEWVQLQFEQPFDKNNSAAGYINGKMYDLWGDAVLSSTGSSFRFHSDNSSIFQWQFRVADINQKFVELLKEKWPQIITDANEICGFFDKARAELVSIFNCQPHISANRAMGLASPDNISFSFELDEKNKAALKKAFRVPAGFENSFDIHGKNMVEFNARNNHVIFHFITDNIPKFKAAIAKLQAFAMVQGFEEFAIGDDSVIVQKHFANKDAAALCNQRLTAIAKESGLDNVNFSIKTGFVSGWCWEGLNFTDPKTQAFAEKAKNEWRNIAKQAAEIEAFIPKAASEFKAIFGVESRKITMGEHSDSAHEITFIVTDRAKFDKIASNFSLGTKTRPIANCELHTLPSGNKIAFNNRSQEVIITISTQPKNFEAAKADLESMKAEFTQSLQRKGRR